MLSENTQQFCFSILSPALYLLAEVNIYTLFSQTLSKIIILLTN